MKKTFIYFSVITLGYTLLSFQENISFIRLFENSDTLYFTPPEGWPQPHYNFKESPVTKNGFVLGRKLFYDPMLSKDSTISCASCHLSYTGFTHIDHALSHGIKGRIGNRNTQTIINPAWQTSFMWDGGVNNLEVQALAPLSNYNEMNHSLIGVVNRLKGSEEYTGLFEDAYGKNTEISGQLTLKALTQFMVTFNSTNSKYDKVMRKDSGIAFTQAETRGLAVFRTNCSSCHTEPLFTNDSFQNNGLPIDTSLNDFGRYTITKAPQDSLKFRVPTLRNIEATYPYMHDGRFKSLQSVLFHYTNGIHHSSTLATELTSPMKLTEDDKKHLIKFLKTLTDMSFLRNKDLAYPIK